MPKLNLAEAIEPPFFDKLHDAVGLLVACKPQNAEPTESAPGMIVDVGAGGWTIINLRTGNRWAPPTTEAKDIWSFVDHIYPKGSTLTLTQEQPKGD